MNDFTKAELKLARDVADKISDGQTMDEKQIAAVTGERLISALFFNDTLMLEFIDDRKMRITASAPSCCNSTYLVCDDDCSLFTNSKFLGILIKKAIDIDDSSESHECQFYEIQTSKGSINLASHNEHNGYYGGTGIDIQLDKFDNTQ